MSLISLESIIETELPTEKSLDYIPISIYYVNKKTYQRFEKKHLQSDKNAQWRVLNKRANFSGFYMTHKDEIESCMLFREIGDHEGINIMMIINNKHSKERIIGRAAELEYQLITLLYHNGFFDPEVDDQKDYFTKLNEYSRDAKKHIERQYHGEPTKKNALIFYLDYTMYKNWITERRFLTKEELYRKTLFDRYTIKEFEKIYDEMERRKDYRRRIHSIKKRQRLYTNSLSKQG